ncbi:myosin heavy chain, striated muscle-like [Asterias rubens]|uniref:myosin heavy chain, striated muscle-like n=1 Tax=Asterias rubens TaxID=7604 RepID=UPI001455C963|nr:myosin heavy chain, striated muscle-like [Asterias rubens]
MSQNTYGVTGEDQSDQNARLTNKHIKTLSFLQDVARENKELRARLDQLEEELSQCGELHALGNDAKERIKKLQQDFNRRLDTNNRTLTQKHKDEIMQLISSKLDAETEWLNEREQLQSLNQALEEKNARLTDQLDQLKKHDLKLDVLIQQLDRTIAQVMELKTANEHLSAESTRLANENIGLKADANQLQDCEACRERLTLELGEAHQKIKEFTFKIEHLENELESARSFKQEKNEGNEKLKKYVARLSKEAIAYQQEIARVSESETSLRGELEEKSTELQEELVERDRMLAFIERLQDEIRKREVLLADSFPKKPIVEKSEGLNFREFVHLKREVNYLREENEGLRLSERMKPLALPSLKGPSPGGDVKEKKKNKASRNSASSSKSSILSISNIR